VRFVFQAFDNMSEDFGRKRLHVHVEAPAPVDQGNFPELLLSGRTGEKGSMPLLKVWVDRCNV
jgi:hypothetical protein